MTAADRATPTDWVALQRSWDVQQEGYLAARVERLEVLAGLAATVGPGAGTAHPVVLDLACGTGSVARAVLAALPSVRVVAVDVDPVLLAIAERTVAADDRVTLVRADLRDPSWVGALPSDLRAGGVDAVLSATALHWLAADRTAALYGEVAGILRPGGLFADADLTPLPAGGLADVAGAHAVARRQQAWAGGAPDWEGWWASLAVVPELAAPLAERAMVFPAGHPEERGHPEEHSGDEAWRTTALRDAGFAEAAVVWRHLDDAVTAALR